MPHQTVETFFSDGWDCQQSQSQQQEYYELNMFYINYRWFGLPQKHIPAGSHEAFSFLLVHIEIVSIWAWSHVIIFPICQLLWTFLFLFFLFLIWNTSNAQEAVSEAKAEAVHHPFDSQRPVIASLIKPEMNTAAFTDQSVIPFLPLVTSRGSNPVLCHHLCISAVIMLHKSDQLKNHSFILIFYHFFPPLSLLTIWRGRMNSCKGWMIFFVLRETMHGDSLHDCLKREAGRLSLISHTLLFLRTIVPRFIHQFACHEIYWSCALESWAGGFVAALETLALFNVLSLLGCLWSSWDFCQHMIVG